MDEIHFSNHAIITFNVAFAEMIKRRIEFSIREALQRTASVALIGPGQVGKTTIALNISESVPAVYLDLKSRLDIEKVRDINAFHAGHVYYSLTSIHKNTSADEGNFLVLYHVHLFSLAHTLYTMLAAGHSGAGTLSHFMVAVAAVQDTGHSG